MSSETPPRAMGYACVDLVKTLVGQDFRARQVAARLGYEYIGLTTSCSLIVPEALLDHVSAVEVELLIVPSILHLRGRIPPDLAALTDIHDLSTGRTHERGGGYAPDGGSVNPLVVPDEGDVERGRQHP
ncbi:hypothetical protein AB0L57_10775 [Nocardia sp. NPDC052254]|uniref:hypothetical protein n=1 Tax=Nocardia sp. NPDC052254 TaxID=3155681 RepID=UPI00342A047C